MTLDTGPKMFSHQDPANNPDIKQCETNDNPVKGFKIGCNSAQFKSCSGFLKIFALVRNLMVHYLPSPSADSKFVLSILKFLSMLNLLCILKIISIYSKVRFHYICLVHLLPQNLF